MIQKDVSFDDSRAAIQGNGRDREAEGDFKSQSTIREEVMEKINKDELTKPELNYLEQSNAIVYGLFYTIGCMSLFIFSTTVASVLLIFVKEIQLVMVMFYFFLAATFGFTVLEFVNYPFKGKNSPYKMIFCVAVLNKLFYLAELVTMDLRMQGKTQANYIYIPYFVHVACLACYVCYCYCKFERPGLSFFNIYLLGAIAACFDASSNSYETLQEDFGLFAIPAYFVLFFYAFIIFFLIV